MKVLMLSPQLGMTGGAERFSDRLASELVGLGHQVCVLCMDTRLSRALSRDYSIVRLSRAPWVPGVRRYGREKFIGRQRDWIRSKGQQFDVVLAHGFAETTAAGVLEASRLGIPTCVKVTSSGAMADYSVVTDSSGSQALRDSVDLIVATSDLAFNELTAGGFPASRIRRISNGVSLPEPRCSTRSPHPVTVVTCVASLRPVKGHDVLIAAWEQVARCLPNAVLQLVGSGDSEGDLRRLVQRLGLQGRVVFLGARSDVEAILRDSDVFVLASRAEGMSNALLEAMAIGLPCVVTAVGSNYELLGPPGSHYVVEPEDGSSLAEALIALLSDEQARLHLGRLMRERVESSYTISSVAHEYEQLFKELVDHRH